MQRGRTLRLYGSEPRVLRRRIPQRSGICGPPFRVEHQPSLAVRTPLLTAQTPDFISAEGTLVCQAVYYFPTLYIVLNTECCMLSTLCKPSLGASYLHSANIYVVSKVSTRCGVLIVIRFPRSYSWFSRVHNSLNLLSIIFFYCVYLDLSNAVHSSSENRGEKKWEGCRMVSYNKEAPTAVL